MAFGRFRGLQLLKKGRSGLLPPGEVLPRQENWDLAAFY